MAIFGYFEVEETAFKAVQIVSQPEHSASHYKCLYKPKGGCRDFYSRTGSTSWPNIIEVKFRFL